MFATLIATGNKLFSYEGSISSLSMEFLLQFLRLVSPDVHVVLQSMWLVFWVTIGIISWDCRRAYIPKRLRRKWDTSILSHYWKSWLRRHKRHTKSGDTTNSHHSCSLTTTALSAQEAESLSFNIDSDSFLIAVDNCASSCMTPDASDFIEPPQETSTTITGMGGETTSSHIGTVGWRIEDDIGRIHEIRIPNTRLCKAAPFRLLCPQHLAQESKDPTSVSCITTHEHVRLEMQGFIKTIALLKGSNVALFRSAPSYKSSGQRVTADKMNNVCYRAHIIPDDDGQITDLEDTASDQNPDAVEESSEQTEGKNATPRLIPPDDDLTDFDPNLSEAAQKLEESEINDLSPTNQLLVWHYRLNHVPFSKLQRMARQGDLPGDLSSCRIPKCSACEYAKATKRPWRTKGRQTT